MSLEMGILKALLQYIVTGGASIFASYILERVKRFHDLNHEIKLYTSYAVTGLIGLAAYFAMTGLLYTPVPVGYVAWVETIVAVVFTAIGIGQIYHRVPQLQKKDEKERSVE